MKLPNLSYLMSVGKLRYIQSVYEKGAYRNPDALVRDILKTHERWGCDLRGRFLLARLRSRPFYYYVIARTKYYDAVFIDAICNNVNYIVNIGCGSDTRAYRFGHILQQKGIKVLECDQAEAINAKRQIAMQQWSNDHVEYLTIDLNDDEWPEFERWLKRNHGASMLVLMEGVSPYVNAESFGRFLDLLASKLQSGSRLAYDFKLEGVAEDFGRSERTRYPFRQSSAQGEAIAYHEKHGYRVEHLEFSAELSLRLLPDLANSDIHLYREDALVRLLLSDSAHAA